MNEIPVRAKRLAAMLLDARRRGRPLEDVPADLLPRNEGEAYEAQDLLAAGLGRVVGWKVGAKSLEARPTYAPLVEPLLLKPGTAEQGRSFRLWRIEAELMFRLGADLPPAVAGYTRKGVLAAIEQVCVGIEIVDSRYAAWPHVEPLLLLADLQSHGAMVVGTGAPFRDHAYDRIMVKLAIDGGTVVKRAGGNPAGDPVELLVWLANRLTETRRGLRKGDLVTTGSCTGMIELASGAMAEATFEGIGSVAVRRL